MPASLQNDEPLPIGIRRMAREIAESALNTVTETEDPEVAIHEFRKRGKEIRALLRLIRDEIGNAIYRRENVFYRDLARPYSDRRDRWVFAETLEGVLGDESASSLHPQLSTARDNILKRHRDEVLPGPPPGFPEAAVALRAALHRIDSWPFDGDEFSTIRKSLRRVYSDGRLAMSMALAECDSHLLHEWRKEVKYLWNQLEFFRPAWEGAAPDLGESWHELSSLLGEDHDLAVLDGYLQANPELAGGDSSLPAIHEAATERQMTLQSEFRTLGEKLYAPEPEEFVGQLEQYWNAARSQ